MVYTNMHTHISSQIRLVKMAVILLTLLCGSRTVLAHDSNSIDHTTALANHMESTNQPDSDDTICFQVAIKHELSWFTVQPQSRCFQRRVVVVGIWIQQSNKFTLTCSVSFYPDAALIARLEELLFNVSDPNSSMYGQYLSAAGVQEYLSESVAPSQQLIMDWLTGSSLQPVHVASNSSEIAPDGHTRIQVSRTGDFIDVCSSVAKAEAQFQTKLVEFTREDINVPISPAHPQTRVLGSTNSPPSKRSIRANSEIVLPTHLIEHIDFIGGINTPIHRMKVTAMPSSKIPHSQKDDNKPPKDPNCAIPSAYADFVPKQPESIDNGGSAAAWTDPIGSPSAFTPRVLEVKAGNEQAYIRWEMRCSMVATPSNVAAEALPFMGLTSGCASTVKAFYVVLRPLERDPSRRVAAVQREHIAASIPLQLANCVNSPDNSGNTVCEASFDVKNYVGYWVTLQVELLPYRVSVNQSPTFVSSCMRGPIFAHELVTTAFLQDRYDIPSHMHTLHQRNNTVAIVEFMETYWNNQDLQTYLRLMDRPSDSEASQPDVTSTAPPMHMHQPSLVGFNNETEAIYTGDEAQLDVQVVMGLLTSEIEMEPSPASTEATAAGSVHMWNVPGREPQNAEEPFLRWVLSVQELDNPPLVYSLSYGDIEEQLPVDYMLRVNVEFIKMGLRGMTIIFPAGDKGVASDFEPEDQACQKSHPEFPVGSPYILAVGGSQLSSTSSRALCSRLHHHLSLCSMPSEVACSADLGGKITSGGGFSNQFKRPAYQEKQVRHYLTHHRSATPKSEGFFNPNGRGYPDVSVYGTHFITINDGAIVPAAGTSASVPVMAAMVALWNDIRLSRNEPPLGFIGPLLYSLRETHPQAFRDIVEGTNRCRLEEQTCCEEGFEAAMGWDAVSGLGAPRFRVIARLLEEGFPHIPPRDVNQSSLHSLQANALGSISHPSISTRFILMGLMLGVLILTIVTIVGGTCRKMSRSVGARNREDQPLMA